MATATNTSCVFNTISISPGTSFVLPPGASIVNVSNLDSVTTECADLTNLETPECYIAKVVLFNNDNGTGEFFEGDGFQCMYAYAINGIENTLGGCFRPDNGYYYPGPPNIVNSPNAGFLKYLKNLVPAITSYNGISTSDGSTKNFIFIYQVKTIPSIGDNLEILIKASAENFITDANYRVKFVKRANATGPLPPSLC